MLIKWGALVVDGRGKIGGQVASKNRQGAYMRNKVTPTNPQTVAQARARSLLASYSQQWRSLTQEQRNAWIAAVGDYQRTNVFGDTVSPNGKNLFTKLNVNLENVAGTPIDTPPSPVEITEPVITSLTAVESTQTIEITPTNTITGETMLVFATKPLSAGIGFFKNQYRLIGTITLVAATANDISSDYVAKFGAFSAGQKIAVKLVPVNDTTGQNGVGASVSVVAT